MLGQNRKTISKQIVNLSYTVTLLLAQHVNNKDPYQTLYIFNVQFKQILYLLFTSDTFLEMDIVYGQVMTMQKCKYSFVSVLMRLACHALIHC